MLQAIHQVLSKDPQQKARIMESSSFYRHYFYLTSVLMKKQRYRTLNQLIYGTAFVKKVLNRVTS